jgi:AAA+ ATPase superfamily predicted ATPase
MGFVGRSRELGELTDLLEVVRRGSRADRGVAVALRGRRRVGKSRLVEEFIRRQDVPHVYFQAARGVPVAEDLALLAETVATSGLPGASVAEGNRPSTLTAALTLVATALPSDTPSVVVLDELPWLLEAVPSGAGELQRVWDRALAGKPVLLLLLGSDLAMMEQLSQPDQAFHGRATEMVLDPLNPRDVARMTGLAAYDALDAYLITGGLPLITQEWAPGIPRNEFLERSFARETSALVVSGARVLDSEFGEATLARKVLTAVGGKGERTFSGIQQARSGAPMNATSLTHSLRTLMDKRMVATEEPLSAKRSRKDRRYRIADPGLRFWLAFVEPALSEVARGRPDLAMERVHRSFSAWRGRAVEPEVRAALQRLLPDETWPDVRRVGGWWPRTNVPEIDLVGADELPARRVPFVGTIKWRDDAALTARDVERLATDAVRVPGVTAQTRMVAVCPAGAVGAVGHDLAELWTAEDLLAAWP